MTPEKKAKFEQINPFAEIRQIEQYWNNWTEGMVSDGEIVHRLAGASAAVAYLQGIVGQSLMDDEEQVAEAKREAAGFDPPLAPNIGAEEIPF